MMDLQSLTDWVYKLDEDPAFRRSGYAGREAIIRWLAEHPGEHHHRVIGDTLGRSIGCIKTQLMRCANSKQISRGSRPGYYCANRYRPKPF